MSLSQSFSQKIGNVRPLNPCPSLDIDFANGGYVNTGGFANQESVGSANFKIGAFNGPDPIFTRATAATFRGSNGLIQYAPENLLIRSEDLSDSNWQKFRITPSYNVTTSPIGTLTADLIVPTLASSGTHAVGQASSIVSNQVYTMTVYAKSFGSTRLMMSTFQSQTVPSNSTLWYFDLANGVVAGSVNWQSASITHIGDGWFRCSGTFVAVATNTTDGVGMYIMNDAGSISYTGDGTSGIYIWGAQLERSSTARPYISTTALPVYGPRFEYDLSGNPLGLLMEEQSQNLLQYSEQFDNAYWGKLNLNTTGSPVWINAVTGPNGTQTAEFIIPNTSSVLHYVEKQLTVSAGVYTASVYAKAGGYNYIVVGESSGPSWAYFNLATGEIGNISGSAVPLIQNAGSGWYRCSVTFTSTGGNKGWFALCDQSNGSLSGFAGNGTSGIYIWGAQLEQKSFVTSYMPTVGGTSTRNADVVSSTISSWFNQTEGTVVVSGDRNNNPTLNSSGLDSFFEFTGTASYLLVHACDGTTEAVYDAAGSPATTVGVTIGSLTSIAASYSDTTDLLHISRNGLATQSGPSTGLGVAPTTLNIGYAPVSLIGYWNGHIKSFRYFPKALPNNLQRLSS